MGSEKRAGFGIEIHVIIYIPQRVIILAILAINDE